MNKDEYRIKVQRRAALLETTTGATTTATHQRQCFIMSGDLINK